MNAPKVFWACITTCLLASGSQAAQLQAGSYGVSLNDQQLYLGAEVSLAQSQASLYFSNGQADPTTLPTVKPASIGGAVGAFNALQMGLTATGEATLTEQSRTVGSLSRVTRTVSALQSAVDQMSVSTDNNTFKVQGLSLNGGLQVKGPFVDLLSEGGSLGLQGLSIDTAEAGRVKVSGQMSGAPYVMGDPAVTGDLKAFDGVIWEGSQVSGPMELPLYEILAATDLNDASWLQQRGYTILAEDMILGANARKVITLQSTQVISGLQMSEGALATFASSFGMSPDEAGAIALSTVNATGGWGTLKITSTFKVYNNCLECNLQPPIPLPSVPEPSTWALMALGLVGVGWTARRQRQALAAA